MTKPGRNDPCPCGSGKKYKKCCGAKQGPKKIYASVLSNSNDRVSSLLSSISTSSASANALEKLKNSASEKPPE
ncbi:MAG: SEC-C domain-containing protein [Simkaniaceae bacterium]|nr:SEC-C domain-containing protein [Simkaniaceae bacterium]